MLLTMFIRCTTTHTKKTGKTYKTFRLVESERVEGKVKQRTLINLGRYFDVPQAQWQALSSRIDQLLSTQTPCVRLFVASKFNF